MLWLTALSLRKTLTAWDAAELLNSGLGTKSKQAQIARTRASLFFSMQICMHRPVSRGGVTALGVGSAHRCSKVLTRRWGHDLTRISTDVSTCFVAAMKKKKDNEFCFWGQASDLLSLIEIGCLHLAPRDEALCLLVFSDMTVGVFCLHWPHSLD